MKKLTLKKGVQFEMVEPGHRDNDKEIKDGYVIIHFEDCPNLMGKWDGYRLPICIFEELTKETQEFRKLIKGGA